MSSRVPWRARTNEGCAIAHGDGAKCDGRTAVADGASWRRLGLLSDYLTRKPSRNTSMSFATLTTLISLTSCLLLGFLSCFFFGGLIDDIVLAWLLGIKLVIVVGCHSLVDRQLESLGITAKVFNGRRVTDKDTLEIVKLQAGYTRFEVERM